MASPVPRRLRVLTISPWSDDWDLSSLVGSPENAFFYEKLVASNIELHLILPFRRSSMPRRSKRDGFFLHPIPNLTFPPIRKLGFILSIITSIHFTLRAFFQGMEVAKKLPIDAIYGIGSVAIPAAALLSRILKKPVIGKLLGVWGLYPIKKFNIHYLLTNFDSLLAYFIPLDRLVVVDDGSQGDRVARELHPPAKKFLFWPNPVNKEWANSPSGKNSPSQGLKDDVVLLAAAQLYVLKGLSYLINAMSIVVAHFPKTKLIIAGTGVERRALETLVEKLHLQPNVRFLGGVRFLDMRDYYQLADIFITTNLCTNATLTTNEAMVSGLPVVAFDVRDTARVVRDGETGLLARPFDTRDLAQKIMTLVADVGLRKKLGEQAKEFALKNLPSWEDRLELEVKLIRELCG